MKKRKKRKQSVFGKPKHGSNIPLEKRSILDRTPPKPGGRVLDGRSILGSWPSRKKAPRR